MPTADGDRARRQDRVTRTLTFLGLAVAVAGPFGLLVVGVENDEPAISVTGLVLGALVLALVLRW